MIVENRLSKNDYYERGIYGLPLLESGYLQHIFLNGIFYLKNCRFLQPVQHIGFENCPEGEAVLLSVVIEGGCNFASAANPLACGLVLVTVKPLAMDGVSIHGVVWEQRCTGEVLRNQKLLLGYMLID